MLELNVYAPIVMYDLHDSIFIMKNALDMFSADCIKGITANEKAIAGHLDRGLIIGTALNPLFGYAQVAEWVKEANKTKKSLKEVVMEKGVIKEKELNEALDPEKLTRPNLK